MEGVKLVPISRLEIMGDRRWHQIIRWAEVRGFMIAPDAGDQFPPIVVDNLHQLVDGRHRFLAHLHQVPNAGYVNRCPQCGQVGVYPVSKWEASCLICGHREYSGRLQRRLPSRMPSRAHLCGAGPGCWQAASTPLASLVVPPVIPFPAGL